MHGDEAKSDEGGPPTVGEGEKGDGLEQETETDYGEYEKVNGIYVPMSEDSGPKNSDSSQKQQLVFDKAEANVNVDTTVFAFPAAK